MDIIKKNEFKVAFLKKLMAFIGSLFLPVIAILILVIGILSKTVINAIPAVLIISFLGYIIIRYSLLHYMNRVFCVPILNAEYTKKELDEMLENEEFSPINSGYSLDGSDDTQIKVSKNWLDIKGYLFNKTLIAYIEIDKENPDLLRITYIDGCYDTVHYKKKGCSEAYNALRRLGFKDISEYALDPEFEDHDEMLYTIFDRAVNEKMYRELTAEGLSFQDIRNLWDAELAKSQTA
ncbi:MAG: hypothetical protein K6G87_19145 [Butyrivibrio sp.]|uniref:hypothetical protein n=1 Tax=Butyrivibrio sp. TaxID=28121 RepID=UPI0025E2FBC5|nr:hypothetical protein [Butyrivibrio sp.]MCR5773343.1 hypothetical protein [Butyrivibrio sp.]